MAIKCASNSLKKKPCGNPACPNKFEPVRLIKKTGKKLPCPERNYCSKNCGNAVRQERHWRCRLNVPQGAAA